MKDGNGDMVEEGKDIKWGRARVLLAELTREDEWAMAMAMANGLGIAKRAMMDQLLGQYLTTGVQGSRYRKGEMKEDT